MTGEKANSGTTCKAWMPAVKLALVLLLFAIFQAVSCSSPGITLSCGRPAGLSSDMLVSSNPRLTPQWTPDGRFLAFTDNVWAQIRDYGPDNYFYYELSTMYLAAADGTSIEVLSDSAQLNPKKVDISPDLSPDGTKAVYATSRHGRGPRGDRMGCGVGRVFELEIVELDSFDRRLLETNPGRQYWDVAPRWSPDGTTIAYVRSSICDTEDFGIYAVNSDGSNVRMVAGFGGYDRWAYYQAGPVWSPKGNALAFVVRVPTANASPWTPEIQAKKSPWEIREKADYFKDTNQPSQDFLYVVNADGTRLRPLYTAGNWPTGRILGAPTWSPDGSRIAFATFNNVYGTRYDEQFPPVDPSHRDHVIHGLTLFTIDPEGLELFKVGEVRVNRAHYFPSSTEDLQLEWSQDGSSIMLSNGYNVEVWSANGAGLQKRIRGSYGSWSPDGSRIAVMNIGTERRNGTVVLSVLDSEGEQSRALVRERVERRNHDGYLEAEYSPDKEPLHQFP